MSAFSRGCLLRHQCAYKIPRTAHFFLLSTSYQQPRFISSTTLLQAAKNVRSSTPLKKVIQKKKPSSTPLKSASTVKASAPPAPTPAPLVYKSYATSLAEKTHSTHLYEAPSHTVYILTCYGTAGFCFTYAAISFWSNYLLAPPDLATWIPVALGGVSFLMACLGGWLVLGPARLVKSIIAVPRNVGMIKEGLIKPGSGPTASELQIEVELRKMFPVPFFPARKFYVKPEEIELPHRFVPVNKTTRIHESRERAKFEAMEKQRMLEYERNHLLTLPFRRMSQLTYKLFIELKRVWTREGMMKVDIQNQRYKVDISAGWALEGGRALDRLAKIKA
ncbi:hypothetical protein ONS95_014694 [Cadophora gregata]|uniref:uncharacterized protein n=1 Tax=Cadophora gregata TaxID=51156 RepID=UPI0026DD4C9E|nr:uncharacterized protein ONS95_014694 [Cadophora gregata]KAK0112980.1 hypothetical protein ONS95_014694 [Cadophora gregata]KAK0125103.1 hypothetical protein ONS96_008970 [Cadophora gregata f. sp. sojae]